MERVSVWVVVLWHALVLVALAYAVGVLRPSRMLFLRPSAWRPVTAWLRTGYFFRFATGRAALMFFLVALVAGILVLVVYLLNRTHPGRQTLALALCSLFLAAAAFTVISRPRRRG